MAPKLKISTLVLVTGLMQMHSRVLEPELPVLEDNLTIDIKSKEGFRVLKDQYSWLNTKIYKNALLYGAKYDVSALLVLAVVDAESTGVRKAKGPRVRVRLGNGKYVRTNALGLMQLIPVFHAPGKAHKLYQTAFNIRLGTRYLRSCLDWADGDLAEALKNYNSGPRSSFYNWPYIKKIRRNFDLSRQRLGLENKAEII